MSPPALEATDLWFAYVRGRPVLQGVSVAAHAGEMVAVLGTSGSGKSTLLRLCRGLLRPARGEVRLLGAPLVPGEGRLDPRIAYIPQQLGLVRSLTVLENVCIGALGERPLLPSLLGLTPPGVTDRARATLGSCGIGHKLEEKAFALSGGERQRVAIARALMQEPRVLIADEFISQLDPFTTGEVMRVVRGVADQGVAVLMATHEQSVVREYADRAVVLRDGAKVADVRMRAAESADIGAALRR
jgi:phosphonate transport system ATP-binding protein